MGIVNIRRAYVLASILDSSAYYSHELQLQKDLLELKYEARKLEMQASEVYLPSDPIMVAESRTEISTIVNNITAIIQAQTKFSHVQDKNRDSDFPEITLISRVKSGHLIETSQPFTDAIYQLLTSGTILADS